MCFFPLNTFSTGTIEEPAFKGTLHFFVAVAVAAAVAVAVDVAVAIAVAVAFS